MTGLKHLWRQHTSLAMIKLQQLLKAAAAPAAITEILLFLGCEKWDRISFTSVAVHVVACREYTRWEAIEIVATSDAFLL